MLRNSLLKSHTQTVSPIRFCAISLKKVNLYYLLVCELHFFWGRNVMSFHISLATVESNLFNLKGPNCLKKKKKVLF